MTIAYGSLSEFHDFLENEKQTFPEKFMRKSECCKCREDFEFIRLIGVGSFGRVYLVKEKDFYNFTHYALKQINKKHVINTKQITHTLCEKRILQGTNFEFLVKLIYFFMDNSSLYYVLPFIGGGELYRLFQQEGPFNEEHTRFYIAQVVLALEYLHYLDIVYRDLKPENLLIDNKGYIKVTDFGLSKIVSGRTYTLCGTPDYIAPEVVLNKGYGKSADFWSLGVLIFELNADRPPFIAPDLMRLYELIVAAKFKLPKTFSKELKDLVKNLLQPDVTKRYGVLKNGILDIKNHNWFQTLNWLALLNRLVDPPYIPTISGPGDADNFDIIMELTEDDYQDDLYDKYKNQFNAF